MADSPFRKGQLWESRRPVGRYAAGQRPALPVAVPKFRFLFRLMYYQPGSLQAAQTAIEGHFGKPEGFRNGSGHGLAATQFGIASAGSKRPLVPPGSCGAFPCLSGCFRWGEGVLFATDSLPGGKPAAQAYKKSRYGSTAKRTLISNWGTWG